MLSFIIKGILRDRHRYLFPILIVMAGVTLIVFLIAFIDGYLGSMVRENANFDTGHLKIVTRAYARQMSQKPYDLALEGADSLINIWKQRYPQLDLVQRISFGALLDKPDAYGVTQAQGEIAAIALDTHNPAEVTRLHLRRALKQGSLPSRTDDVLISDTLFRKLNLSIGDKVTLIGSTMYGSMTLHNVHISGTVTFGVELLDRGGIIMDIRDAKTMLDMENASAETLAFFHNGVYNEKQANAVKQDFNRTFSNTQDDYSPTMLTLSEQNNLGFLLHTAGFMFNIMTFIFVLLMAIVLWNSGLMNGLRRYGEYGVRLAMGEDKGHLYRWHIWEALCVGIVGTALGVLIGSLIIQHFHRTGMDMSVFAASSNIMIENVIYTSLSLKSFLYGIIPGIMATVLGALLSGMGIYKRQTASLFKELET